nr:MAG TPA: hypothetical protein [Caudoviricetes sp.]
MILDCIHFYNLKNHQKQAFKIRKNGENVREMV